ncbi:hypothetical protein HDU98_011709 [Podochytrium sp. JEL0797]|nr:hypothetical protein HDU98_011709 [Podochytrium sp. JEL0797]
MKSQIPMQQKPVQAKAQTPTQQKSAPTKPETPMQNFKRMNPQARALLVQANTPPAALQQMAVQMKPPTPMQQKSVQAKPQTPTQQKSAPMNPETPMQIFKRMNPQAKAHLVSLFILLRAAAMCKAYVLIQQVQANKASAPQQEAVPIKGRHMQRATSAKKYDLGPGYEIHMMPTMFQEPASWTNGQVPSQAPRRLNKQPSFQQATPKQMSKQNSFQAVAAVPPRQMSKQTSTVSQKQLSKQNSFNNASTAGAAEVFNLQFLFPENAKFATCAPVPPKRIVGPQKMNPMQPMQQMAMPAKPIQQRSMTPVQQKGALAKPQTPVQQAKPQTPLQQRMQAARPMTPMKAAESSQIEDCLLSMFSEPKGWATMAPTSPKRLSTSPIKGSVKQQPSSPKKK